MSQDMHGDNGGVLLFHAYTQKCNDMSNAALCMCNRNSLLNTKILPKTDMYSNYIYI